MTDRFDFRVWDTEDQGWADNVVLNIYGELYIDSTGVICEEGWPNRFVIQQCTGLKDKNGKALFEGDLVKCGLHLGKRICKKVPLEIEYAFGAFGFSVHGEFFAVFALGSKSNFEILGNIYENPELLND